MSQERLSMRKFKEILRLKFELGLSNRMIARSCTVSRRTVAEYIRRAERAGLSWPLPEDRDHTALEALLFPSGNRPVQESRPRPFPSMEEVHEELQRKHVTLQLLWHEYKETHPDGYQYSQFCDLYRRWKKKLDVVLRQEHRAGEKLFIDYAGRTVPIIDATTGEVSPAQIFIAVCGASNYTFAEASRSQDLFSWIHSHIRAFEYFGGIPEILVPDNLRSAISKACRYEPDINPTYQAMCEHYGTTVIPARKRKPRDKAKVEVGVLIVSRWILAALRNRTFHNLAALNQAISQLLLWLNHRKFKKLPTTRKELFEKIDKPALKPLPVQPYPYSEWSQPKVHIDYHVEVDGHFYSVPYSLTHEHVDVRLTATTVEVLFKGQRVASHPRSYVKGTFTTLSIHRPKSHQQYLEWTPERIIRWAEETGPATAELVAKVMAARPHPEQGFRSCLGILRLRDKYTPERLEAACTRALGIQAYSYKSIHSILKTGLDRQPLVSDSSTQESVQTIHHPNIRGKHYYQPQEDYHVDPTNR
jgi:transposase